MDVMKLIDIKKALRDGKYAFPGGYPKFFVMADGEPMSFEAVRDCWREIVSAHLTVRVLPKSPSNWDKSWVVVGVEINWEDADLYCAHTNNRIESAYAEREAA